MPCIETNEVNGHMVEAVGPSPSTPKLGMLAWRLLLHSPEFPEGRSVVLIANDVTHQAGWVPTWQDGCWRVKLGMSELRGVKNCVFCLWLLFENWSWDLYLNLSACKGWRLVFFQHPVEVNEVSSMPPLFERLDGLCLCCPNKVVTVHYMWIPLAKVKQMYGELSLQSVVGPLNFLCFFVSLTFTVKQNLIHGKVPLVLLKIISSRKPANTLANVAYHVSLSLATVVHGSAWWKKSCLKSVSIGKMKLIRPRRRNRVGLVPTGSKWYPTGSLRSLRLASNVCRGCSFWSIHLQFWIFIYSLAQKHNYTLFKSILYFIKVHTLTPKIFNASFCYMCLPTPLFKKSMWPLQLHIFQTHFRPVEGFDYLYLTEADFTSFPSGAVIGKFVPGVGYALDAVVGQGLSYLGLQQRWWKEWTL